MQKKKGGPPKNTTNEAKELKDFNHQNAITWVTMEYKKMQDEAKPNSVEPGAIYLLIEEAKLDGFYRKSNDSGSHYLY